MHTDRRKWLGIDPPQARSEANPIAAIVCLPINPRANLKDCSRERQGCHQTGEQYPS
ncbi:hypothetical protein [Oxynema aestuarii]|uniref:hypothetical protein n=1 Tax=Oxynema aestuarii TaxID=2874213 RepID=UPI001B30E8DE|nr:hypothetical protein [Oxynema aestuarii]